MDAAPPPEPNPYEPPRARRGTPPSRPIVLAEVVFGSFVLLVAGGVAFVATCLPLGGQIRGIDNRRTGTWVDWAPEAGGIAAAIVAMLWLGRFWFGPASPSRSRRRPPQS